MAQAIRSALDAAGGAEGLAAERFATDRTTLYRLIRKYRLETED
jgi:transcriptional regulator of acetoin/glycerol metabolism